MYPKKLEIVSQFEKLHLQPVLFIRTGIDSATVQCPEGMLIPTENSWGDDYWRFGGTYHNTTSISNFRDGRLQKWTCVKVADRKDSNWVAQVNPLGLKIDSIMEKRVDLPENPFPYIKWLMGADLDFGHKHVTLPNVSQHPSNWATVYITDTMYLEANLSEGFSYRCRDPKTKKHYFRWGLGIHPNKTWECEPAVDTTHYPATSPVAFHQGQWHEYRVFFTNPIDIYQRYPRTNYVYFDSIDYPKKEIAVFFERPKLDAYMLEPGILLAHVQAYKYGNTYDFLYAIKSYGGQAFKALYTSYYKSDKDYQKYEIGISNGAFRVKKTVAQNGMVQISKMKWAGGPTTDND